MTSTKAVQTEVKESNESKVEPSKNLVSSLTKVISFSSVFSILMGFGYMSGIATSFGYSAFDIVADTKSFIFQGLYPLFKLFFEKLSWSYWGDLIASSASSWDVLIYVGASFIAYLIYKKYSNASTKKAKFKSRVQKVWGVYQNQSQYFKCAIEIAIIAVISVLYKVFITLLVYGAFAVFTSVIVFGFGIGYREGLKFAKEEIIEPQQCAPYIKKTGKEVKKTAYCTSVIANGKEVARGRVIAQNSDRIFLYVKENRINDKQEKEEIRVPKSYPIKDAIIERVDTEDFTKPSSKDS